MTARQKALINTIIARWSVSSFNGLRVEQAALDIGTLCGIIAALEDPPARSRRPQPPPRGPCRASQGRGVGAIRGRDGGNSPP